MTLSERIKQLREEKRLSQSELAEILGISKQTVSNYETGARKPGLKLAVKYADVFGLTVDCILGLSDKPEKATMPKGSKLPERAEEITVQIKEFKDKIRELRMERFSSYKYFNELLRRNLGLSYGDIVFKRKLIPDAIKNVSSKATLKRIDDLMNQIVRLEKDEPSFPKLLIKNYQNNYHGQKYKLF